MSQPYLLNTIRLNKRGEKQKVGYRAKFTKTMCPQIGFLLNADVALSFRGTKTTTLYKIQITNTHRRIDWEIIYPVEGF